MVYLHFILGLVVIAVLALLASNNRKNIKYRYIIQLLIIELALAYFLLNSSAGTGIVKEFADAFNGLLSFASDGTNFVFGNLSNNNDFNFFLNVLMPIVFISALIGILQHIKVLPYIIKGDRKSVV